MSYTVLMIRAPAKGRPVPAHELEDTFETREAAVAAATRELASRGTSRAEAFKS